MGPSPSPNVRGRARHCRRYASISQLWDDYFAPGYGVPNDAGMEAVKLLASLDGVLLDPVYTGKAMAGLIDGISQKRFNDDGPILFIHTGGAPALFAYHPHV